MGGILGFLGNALGGPVGAGLSLASGLFGSKSKGTKPATSQSQSGWSALPPQVQQAYLNNYLPGVNKYFSSGSTPGQKQAYASLGGGLGSLVSELPGYLDIFQQNVTDPTLDEIQRGADIEKNRLNALAATNGLGGLLNSNLGVQNSMIQENANRLKTNVNYAANRENLFSALSLRDKTLADILNGGDEQYQRLSKYSNLLGRFPMGSTSTGMGEAQPKPNTWDKVAGGATALGGLINDYRDRPWLYNIF